MLAIAISTMACSKNDDNENIQDQLNINEIANLIDKSVGEVKTTFKGELINETTTLGITKLSYHLATKEAGYLASFTFNKEGYLNELWFSPDEKYSYSTCVNFMKTISDRIAAAYPEKTYMGYAGYGSYDERSKYWDKISKDSPKNMYENWFLINEATIKETLKLSYLSGDTFAISIEKNVY